MTVTLENLDGKSSLLELLRSQGVSIAAPCGGRGNCGRCKVKANGREVLACSEYPDGKVTIELESSILPDIKAKTAAVDIGTTNVAVLLDGKTKISMPNAMRAYGADVVTRIEFCRKGQLDELSRLVQEQVQRMCCGAERISIVGNTVMQYIYAGIDPSPLATPPFRTETLFNSDPVLAPCISAYVGGDMVAALAAAGAEDMEGLVLLVDIGTNGEMALGNKNGFIACASPAGPAFENGMNGLYGSEIINIVANGLNEGIVGRSGAIKKGLDDFPLSRDNIRDVLLAKAAVRSGIDVLLEESGHSPEDITELILAGDFGTYINIDSAEQIGLIPHCKKVTQAGNLALKGAQLALEDREFLERTADLCSYLDLSLSPLFPKAFAANTMFVI